MRPSHSSRLSLAAWPCNAEERQMVGSQIKRPRLNLDWRQKRSAEVGGGDCGISTCTRRTLLSKGTARVVTDMTPRGALLIANSACCKLLSPMLCCVARYCILRALRGCCWLLPRDSFSLSLIAPSPRFLGVSKRLSVWSWSGVLSVCVGILLYAARVFPGSSQAVLCRRVSLRLQPSSAENVRILVSSSKMAWSESASIFSASEGMRVVASSAVSGVRVPTVCQKRPSLVSPRGAAYPAVPSRPWSALGGCRTWR